MFEGTGDGPSMQGQVLKGRYLVLEPIGEGGMGSAWLAEDRDLHRRVVVKAPKPELLADRQFRVRFEREVQNLLGLDHPHVTKVLDAGTSGPWPFLVLPFLSGGSLQDRLERSPGPQRIADVLAWLPDIARALDFIHDRGFVHRDVKPGNVMFDEHGNAFLGDFGIARAVDEKDAGLTQTGTIVGSPRYLAPEIALGRPAVPASDQYSLATIAYLALSASLPHDGPTPLALVAQKASQPPRPLTDAAPGTPPAIAACIMRALDGDPARRFPSCVAFASALAGASASSPPPAPRDLAATETLIALEAPAGATPAVAMPLPHRPAPRRRWGAVAGLLAVGAVAVAAWQLLGDGQGRTEPAAPAAAPAPSARRDVPLAPPEDAEPAMRPPPAATAPALAEPALAEPLGATDGAADAPPPAEPSPEAPTTTVVAAAEAPAGPAAAVAPAPSTGAPTPASPAPSASPVTPPAVVAAASPPATAPAPARAASSPPLPRPAAPAPGATVATGAVTAPAEAMPPAPRLVPLGTNAEGARVAVRSKDGARVILVPASRFRQGSPAAGDEGPERDVSVGPFWLDETEVTWRQYYAYMRAQGIQKARIPSWNPSEDHPAVNLDWETAARYCAWAGGRLPTEAEWELAARGTEGRTWPWGSDWSAAAANWTGPDAFAQTAPVGSFPAGKGPFGHLDLAGNAAEWVADWYDPQAPAAPGATDPRGPAAGTERVVRGGSFNSKSQDALRGSRRSREDPARVLANYGVRCAMDP